MSKAMDIFPENEHLGVFFVEKKDNPQKNEAFLCYGIYKKGDFYKVAADSPEYSHVLKDKKFYASDYRGIPHLAEYRFAPDAEERFYVFKNTDDMVKWQKDGVEEMKEPEIDNFKILSEKVLKFNSDDDFYLVELIIRKKDHPGNDEMKSQQIIGQYWIDTPGKLEKIEDEIKKVCMMSGARAYLNPSVKSYKKSCFCMMEKLLDRIKNEDYRKFYRSSVSAAASTGSRDPWWIIDIDEKLSQEKLDEYCKVLAGMQRDKSYSNESVILPTKNGWHILTKPFNLFQWQRDIEVKKNAPTVLYVPSFQD